jgi:hypothetical protein
MKTIGNENVYFFFLLALFLIIGIEFGFDWIYWRKLESCFN